MHTVSLVLDTVEVEVTLRRLLGDLDQRDGRGAERVGPDVLAREIARLQGVEARVGLRRRSHDSGCTIGLERPVDDLEVLRQEAIAHVLISRRQTKIQ